MVTPANARTPNLPPRPEKRLLERIINMPVKILAANMKSILDATLVLDIPIKAPQ